REAHAVSQPEDHLFPQERRPRWAVAACDVDRGLVPKERQLGPGLTNWLTSKTDSSCAPGRSLSAGRGPGRPSWNRGKKGAVHGGGEREQRSRPGGDRGFRQTPESARVPQRGSPSSPEARGRGTGHAV